MSKSIHEVSSDLCDKYEDLKESVREIQRLLREPTVPELTRQRAESYWLAHIRQALDSDHSYLGGSMFTMEDTMREIDRVCSPTTEEEE